MFLGWIRGTNKAFVNRKELAYQSAVDELSLKSGLTFTKYYENQTTFNGTYGNQYDNSDLSFSISNDELFQYKIFITAVRLKYDSMTIESTAGGGADLDIRAKFYTSTVIMAGRISTPIDLTVYGLYIASFVTLGESYGGTVTTIYDYIPIYVETNYHGWPHLDSDNKTISVSVGPQYSYFKASFVNGLLSLTCYGLV